MSTRKPRKNEADGADYLFWDQVHPTTQMHALIADRVYADLQTQAPELNPDYDDDDSTCFIQTLWGSSTYHRQRP